MESENKENSHETNFMTPVRMKRRSMFETRTPLQDVNQPNIQPNTMGRSCLMKKAQYSPITPVATASSRKTPRRKSKAAKVSDVPGLKPGEQVCLNSLIYKQVLRMLDASKQEYEEKLNKHEKYIASLEDRLSSLDIAPDEPSSNLQIDNVALCKLSLDLSAKTENNINKTELRSSETTQVSTPLCQQSCETEAQTDTIDTTNIEAQTDEVFVLGGHVSLSPPTYRNPGSDTETQTCTAAVSSSESQTRIVETRSCEAQTTTVKKSTIETDTHDLMINIDSDTQTNVSMINVSWTDCETNTEVFELVSSETNMTPKKYVDSEMSTTPECLFMGRPSDMGLERISDVQLRSEFEVASVSNSLLRNEITQLQQLTEQLQNQLRDAQLQLQEAAQNQRQAVIKAKKLAEETIQSNEHLHEEVAKRVELLEAQLVESQDTIETLNEKHGSQVNWFKNQMSSLQQDLVMAYNQKKEEIESLRKSSEEYKQLYHSSHAQRTSLEGQLQTFVSLQDLIRENSVKSTDASKAMNEMKELIVAQHKRLLQDKQLLQNQAASLSEEREFVEKERIKINAKSLQISDIEDKCSMLELQIQESEKSAKVIKEENDRLEQDLSSLKTKCQELSENAITKEKEFQNVQMVCTRLEEQLFSSNKMFEESLEDIKQNLTDIERERDRMASECETKDEMIRHLELDLSQAQSWHKQMCQAKDQVQKMQNAVSENQEFHEAEMNALRDESAEVKIKLEEVKVKYDQMKVKYRTLLEQAHSYESKLSSSRHQCQDLEQELHYTKTSAHIMLLQQNKEITETKLALDDLSALISTIHGELENRLRSSEDESMHHENEQPAELTPEVQMLDVNSHDPGVVLADGVPRSFLSSVMEALTTDTSGTKENKAIESPCEQGSDVKSSEDESVDKSDGEESQAVVIGSNSSAFRRISMPPVPAGQQGVPAEVHVSDKSSCHIPDEQLDSEPATEASMNDESSQLTDQVECIHNTVIQVARLFQQLDKNYSQQEDDLLQHINALQDQRLVDEELRASLNSHVDETRIAYQKQLKEAELTEKRLHSEIKELRAKVTEQLVDLERSRKSLDEHAAKLAEHSEETCQNQKMKEKIKQLETRIEESSAENALLRERLETSIEAMAQSHGEAAGKYARENYLMRSEVHKMRFELIQAKDEAQELASKANNRQRTLQHNLKSAEKEIVKLDDTIEKLRQVLRKHHKEVRAWPELGSLWMEIIYDKRFDDEQMSWAKSKSSDSSDLDLSKGK